MENYIGIDVAKATLQIYIPKNDIDVEIQNSPDGLKKLYSKLKKQYKKEIKNIVFVYESTGAYSTILEQFCQEKEILCFKVGAYQSASFSKVIKNRSKTDKLDAQMLSKMNILAKEKDIKVPKRDEESHQIRSYIKYYQSLVKEHRRQSNYLEASTYNLEDKFILKQVKKKITAIDKEKAMIIEKVLEIIKANPTYSRAYENITSIKGIKEKSGIILLYLFCSFPLRPRWEYIREVQLNIIFNSHIHSHAGAMGARMEFRFLEWSSWNKFSSFSRNRKLLWKCSFKCYNRRNSFKCHWWQVCQWCCGWGFSVYV